jgi:hypothetical protein
VRAATRPRPSPRPPGRPDDPPSSPKRLPFLDLRLRPSPQDARSLSGLEERRVLPDRAVRRLRPAADPRRHHDLLGRPSGFGRSRRLKGSGWTRFPTGRHEPLLSGVMPTRSPAPRKCRAVVYVPLENGPDTATIVREPLGRSRSHRPRAYRQCTDRRTAHFPLDRFFRRRAPLSMTPPLIPPQRPTLVRRCASDRERSQNGHQCRNLPSWGLPEGAKSRW